jgi:hypothetical protein
MEFTPNDLQEEPGMAEMQPTMIRMTESDRAWLRSRAAATERNLSQQVRWIIRQARDRDEPVTFQQNGDRT